MGGVPFTRPSHSPRRLPQLVAGSRRVLGVVVLSSIFAYLLCASRAFAAFASMWLAPRLRFLLAALSVLPGMIGDGRAVDLSWHAPSRSRVNNLTAALTDSGVYGFIFNSSVTPDDEYGTYNWCNMPHVRRAEYERAPAEYRLRYVEVVGRSRALPYPVSRSRSPVLTEGRRRSNDTTNGRRTRRTRSRRRATAGTATTRGCTVSHGPSSGVGRRPRATGRATRRR